MTGMLRCQLACQQADISCSSNVHQVWAATNLKQGLPLRTLFLRKPPDISGVLIAKWDYG